MAIQSDLPFKFNIYTRRQNGTSEICNKRPIIFYDRLEDMNTPYYEPEINIIENRTLCVVVQTDTYYQMEIEGMDVLPKSKFRHQNRYFCDIANKEVPIFSYEDFPLSPGDYVITVVCNGRTFYTGFSVGSLRLSSGLWMQMAEETFQEIQGMAQQLVHQKLGILHNSMDEESVISIYYRIMALKNFYAKVMLALNDLTNNPHSRIVKNYVLTGANRHMYPGDFRCSRLNSRNRPGERLYTPVKYKDYDLAENRYIKRILKNIKNLIRAFMQEADGAFGDLNAELESLSQWRRTTQFCNIRRVSEDLPEVMEKARKISSAITALEKSEWYKSVADTSMDFFSGQSVLDPRYGILDKLYKMMMAKSLGFTEESNLALSWKRSSDLYELWGFIQVIKALEKRGFVLQDGPWIIRDDEGVHLGGLKSGDRIWMESPEMGVRLTYDGDIPSFARDTDPWQNPVYMLDVSSHITPDCKMDFYFQGEKSVYAGSLVIDFKYRAKQYIWGNKEDKESTREQLYSYSVFARSPYLLDKPVAYALNVLHPVYEVWAVHPGEGTFKADMAHWEYGVIMVPVVPGQTDCLDGQLERFFSTYLGMQIV